MCEMNIPVTKVGLIIGKGGETIKRLEEQSGAKIVVIQVNAPAANEKPLRMFGSAESIEHAKKLVIDILNQGHDRDMQFGVRGRSRGQGRGGFPIRAGRGGGGGCDGYGGATVVEKRFEGGQPAALGRGQKRAHSKSSDPSAAKPLPCHALAEDSKLQVLEQENSVLKKKVEELEAELVRSKASEFEPQLKSLYDVLNNLEELRDCSTKTAISEPLANASTKQIRVEVLENVRYLMEAKVDSKIMICRQALKNAVECYEEFLALEYQETDPKLKQQWAASVQAARDRYRYEIDNRFQTIPWNIIRATSDKLTLALDPFDMSQVVQVNMSANAIVKMINTIVDEDENSPNPKRTEEAVKQLTEKLAEISDTLQKRESVISNLCLKHLTKVALKRANAEYEHYKSGKGEITDADSRFKEFLPALKTAHLKLKNICEEYDRVVKISLQLQPVTLIKERPLPLDSMP